MHLHTPVAACQNFFGGILPMDMAKIAVADLVFPKDFQQFPALHIIIYRRVMEESHQLSPQGLCLFNGGQKPACLPADNFSVFLGFRVIEPSPGAANGFIAYSVGAVMQNVQGIPAVLQEKAVYFVPGRPPVIVIAF